MRGLWLLALLLFAPACGGGGAGGPCGAVGMAVCNRACACRGDGKCTVLVPMGSGSASLTFNSAADCATETNLVCGNSPAAQTVDYNACQAGLSSAQCVADASEGGAMALMLPAPCAPLY